MKWMKYTIITTEEACDLVCSMLNDLGITSLEIEDKAPVSPEERTEGISGMSSRTRSMMTTRHA